MKDYLKNIVSGTSNKLFARGKAVEYCQEKILQSLQEKGAFQYWVFHGGTALRFLYALPRYSDDLDFTLADKTKTPDFRDIIQSVKRAFEAEAYNVQLKINDEKTVKSSFIRFPGLPYELGLSPHQSEVLAVKVELDTNPPMGGTTMTTIIRRSILLNLFHHDRQSLLAWKLHAILSRRYTKGRDIYDLLWYLSEPTWPDPNLIFLNNALRQTHWTGPEVTRENWTNLLVDRLESVDWSKVVDDVRPFIERESELALLTKENVVKLIKSR
jgi:predicted nucleotidyltransferase component of viral defense system